MNKYIKFPLVLGSVALASGTLLATTYQLTKDDIAQGAINRQTAAINDLFEKIDEKEILEIPSDFASKGVKSIVKVKSEGNEYHCYTIDFTDSVGGDKGSVIVALDSNAKVYGVKFVSTGDAYMSKYNDDTYLASVVTKDSFDAISGATFTGDDLNLVLKIAKDCMSGKEKEPIDILFDDNISLKIDISKPAGTNENINAIHKITSLKKIYYVYDVSFIDSKSGDSINVLYALNGDGSLYKIKIVSGNDEAKLFDLANKLDKISASPEIKADFTNYYDVVSDTQKTLIYNEIFDTAITGEENIDFVGANKKIKEIKKVTINSQIYYAYRVDIKDTYGGDKLNILYILKNDGSLYKVKILVGDEYAQKYDLLNDFDGISKATYTKGDINTYYTVVKSHYDTLRAGE